MHVCMCVCTGYSVAVTESGDLYVCMYRYSVAVTESGDLYVCMYRYSVAVTESGDLYAWGSHNLGQCGLGEREYVGV
jgi:alpha-tubulin suppressor-like RCC1 family protein